VIGVVPAHEFFAVILAVVLVLLACGVYENIGTRWRQSTKYRYAASVALCCGVVFYVLFMR